MSSSGPSEPDGLSLLDCRHWLLAEYARSAHGASADAFVRAYDVTAYQTAWRVLRVREDAEEVAQDALFRLLRAARAGTFRPRTDSAAAERGYVCGAAVNEALSRLEKRRSHPPPATGIDLSAQPEHRGAGPDDPRAARLWTCLGCLDAHFFGIIERRFFAGLSVGETAEQLGILPGAIKSRTAAALRRLADCCRPDDEEPR